ncbi:MAG: hypothetical protein ACK5M7_21495, partial [Draconibacterium sp.]
MMNHLLPLTKRSILFCFFFMLTSHFLFAQSPTTASSNLNVTNIDGDRFYVSFTRGDGEKRIIIASEQPITSVPQNGVDYLAGNFGEGNEIAPGEYVVYEGTSSGSWIYGLGHSTTYYLRIYEFNGSDFDTEYLTTQYLAGTGTTVSSPATQASNINFSNIEGTAMRVNWGSGNGSGRLLIGRADSAVNVEPEDLISYYASSYFGNGTDLGNGNFVLYQGNSTYDD